MSVNKREPKLLLVTHLAKLHAGADPPLEIGRRIPPVGIVATDTGEAAIRGTGINRTFEGMPLARKAAHHVAGGVDLGMATHAEIVHRRRQLAEMGAGVGVVADRTEPGLDGAVHELAGFELVDLVLVAFGAQGGFLDPGSILDWRALHIVAVGALKDPGGTVNVFVIEPSGMAGAAGVFLRRLVIEGFGTRLHVVTGDAEFFLFRRVQHIGSEFRRRRHPGPIDVEEFGLGPRHRLAPGETFDLDGIDARLEPRFENDHIAKGLAVFGAGNIDLPTLRPAEFDGDLLDGRVVSGLDDEKIGSHDGGTVRRIENLQRERRHRNQYQNRQNRQ